MSTRTLEKTLIFWSVVGLIGEFGGGCSKVAFTPANLSSTLGSASATDPSGASTSGDSNPSSGSTGSTSSTGGAGSTGSTGGNSNGTTSSSNTSPTPPPICQGFAGDSGSTAGTSSASGNGIEASITYIPSTSPLVANSGAGLTTASFQPGMPGVVSLPNPIFLNQLNIYTQNFTLGFQTDSGPITDINGNLLDQFFSLHIPGEIMLNAGNTSGPYQFALLSDDGSVMSIENSSGTYQTLISNDGVRSNTLACGTANVNLTVGQPLNFKIDYFQGPPVRLALVLLWRTGASLNTNEPNCGVQQGDDYYFTEDPTTGLPDATSNWTNMLSNGGWQVVPAANYYLPTGTTNPCQ